MAFESIIKHLTTNQPRILVVGDVMLDQFIWSDSSRISPEAPVPVCLVRETTHVPGGAGNVVANSLSLNATVVLAAACGNDWHAEQLIRRLHSDQLQLHLLHQSDALSTICKARVIARNQQLCRLDYERSNQDYAAAHAAIMPGIIAEIPTADVVILSDYNKGFLSLDVCQAIIRHANESQTPVIVDPKGFSAKKYVGATYLTPNMSELRAMTNTHHFQSEDHIHQAVRHLIQTESISYVLLTRSEDGMSLMSKTTKIDAPTKALSVIDVTGAGDTVVSAMAGALAAGASQSDMVAFANVAAGVVVSKVGTACASLDDIRDYG